MSDQLHFDHFVKEQLGGYKAEVPDRIWNNIVAARRKSKPKGFWFLNKGLLLIAGILLGSLTGGYMIYNSQKNPVTSGNKQTVVPSSQNTKEIERDSKGVKENSDVDNSSNQSEGVKISSSTSGALLSQIPEVTSNPFSKVPVNSRALPGNNLRNRNSGSGSSETSIIADNHSLPIVNPINNSAVHNGSSESTLVNDIKEELLNRFTPLSSTNARQLSSNNNILPATKFVGCPTLERNAAGNKRYWEIYAGPDYIIKNYKTFGDTASYNYLQKRKASTTLTSAFSAGVRYTRVFNNGMSARTGINFSQVNEKFSYINPSELKFITVITRRVVVRAPGDTLYFSDTLQYQQTGTHVRTTYNHYRNIDIPLVIGYELGNGKVHANINAGVIINVYSWYKGDVLDTSYQPVTITTGKGTNTYQYKTNIGVGFCQRGDEIGHSDV